MNNLASVLRDIVTMLCITALAVAHVIPGSTAVALLGPYLALRALMQRRPPGGGEGGGGGSALAIQVDDGTAPPTQRSPVRVLRRALARVGGLVVLAAARTFDPLADLQQLVAAAEQLRRLARELVADVELGLWQAAGAVAAALRPARRA